MALAPEKLKEIGDSYDDFPYDSYPFPQTSPEHLYTVGKLFGMNPPPMETARVLELGCAAGNNLLNFAFNYPKSYTLGVDLSKTQIEHGLNFIKEAGLKNIDLKQVSITELDESYGKFDYIICHGVFSWVPDFVREKILEISKTLLSPNGIAFISYNTLPGWNMINVIRDMMLYHTSNLTDSRSKLNQAKLFFKFITESLEEVTTPYANFLKEEAKSLATRDDSYIMHEYLEVNNKQFYFQDFMTLARSHGLNYLGDANISSMYLGNLPEKAVKELQVVTDIVKAEQYMDFIQNKRFRSTLLCHDNISINRHITGKTIEDFYISCDLLPEKPEKDIDLNNSLESIKFSYATNEHVSVISSSPRVKAILYALVENRGNPLKVDEVIKLAHKKLPSSKIEDLKNELNAMSPNLAFTGHIYLYARKPNNVFKISTKPKVSNLVRSQLRNLTPNREWVTTQTNEVFVLQIHEKYILEHLDGKNTIEAIEKIILERFISGDIVANTEANGTITDEKILKGLSKEVVNSSLERFKLNNILIA